MLRSEVWQRSPIVNWISDNYVESFPPLRQTVRLCFSSFSEKIQVCARSFPGKQTSVAKSNKLTEIRLISKTRLGVSPSTTYFSWLLPTSYPGRFSSIYTSKARKKRPGDEVGLLRWSVNWEELVKYCSKWRKRSRSLSKPDFR